MRKFNRDAVPGIVERILTARPFLARPADLRERNAYQMRVLTEIAETTGTVMDADLLQRVGAAYATHVPHS